MKVWPFQVRANNYPERKQDLPQCTGEVMLSSQSLHVTICHRMASTFELGDDQVFKKNALKDNGRDLGKTEYMKWRTKPNVTFLIFISCHFWPPLWSTHTRSGQEDEEQEVLWRWHSQCSKVKETIARYSEDNHHSCINKGLMIWLLNDFIIESFVSIRTEP